MARMRPTGRSFSFAALDECVVMDGPSFGWGHLLCRDYSDLGNG
jgi:hypothetical protein